MTQRRTTGTPDRPGRKNGLIIAGVVAAVALIAVILATMSPGGGSSSGETAEVAVSGDALPALPQEQGPDPDPAAGMTMPELRGVAFDGTEVSILNDGRPKVILFLTHW